MAGGTRVSRAALAEVREQLATALADGADAGAVSRDLFGVLHLLTREHVVRRTLADPSIEADRRAGLAHSLVGGRVSEPAARVLDALVRARWSSPAALAECVEYLAVEAEVTAADRAGQSDEFVDELFRFGRIVEGRPALRAALTDQGLPDENKRGLVTSLLEGRVTPSTLHLVTEAVESKRGRSLADTIDFYIQVAADYERRLVAHVKAAVELTDAERQRLVDALQAQYGQQVRLNVEVDPAVIGGLSIVLGSELIDGTIARRLDEARRRLAG